MGWLSGQCRKLPRAKEVYREKGEQWGGGKGKRRESRAVGRGGRRGEGKEKEEPKKSLTSRLFPALVESRRCM